MAGPASSSVRVGLGAYGVTEDHLTTIGIKAWALVVFGILFAAVLHLQRLFAQLAAGSTYTRENVRLIEPGTSGIGILPLGPTSLSGFAMAALVLLASWIVDVGRQTADDADAMRREADLVI